MYLCAVGRKTRAVSWNVLQMLTIIRKTAILDSWVMLQVNIILFLSFLVGISKADYCQENFTLAELPGGILGEGFSLFVTGTINDFVGCPNTSVPDKDVNFLLYTRQNPVQPFRLNEDNLKDKVKPNKQFIFLIHGWLCNTAGEKIPELKNAYLKRYDANIIAVDWSAVAVDLYTTSFCRAHGVAKIVGRFICKLNSALEIDPSELHVLGHSLGAQVSGLAGQEVQRKCNKKIGRITGLDPAGPLYQGIPTSQRLDATDAMFVDVIHSNQAGLGYYGSCGHVDFYPNCGTSQPGCVTLGITTNSNHIINMPVKEIFCNHVRSLDFMLESINSNRFRAVSCNSCPGLPVLGPCLPDIFFATHVDMGENCPWNTIGGYFLITNAQSPYARG